MLETLHKEIDLIQSVITRMSDKSFLLKGWLITLVAAILALSKDTLITEDITYLSLILSFPVLIFWYLDAFFLHKEKCYRKLYDWVIEHRSNSQDHLYSLNYKRFESKVGSEYKVMFTKTLLPFYGTILCFLIFIWLYNLKLV